MALQNELIQFFSTVIFDREPELDRETIGQYLSTNSPEKVQRVVIQLRALSEENGLALEEIGTHSNRWFGEESEARDWLVSLLSWLQEERASESSGTVTKDSNGAVLQEGDSVVVIKDLKVRGGSSDLKRGTMIKKIHIVDDPEVIECRVDGSTLVLKTCFLKKA